MINGVFQRQERLMIAQFNEHTLLVHDSVKMHEIWLGFCPVKQDLTLPNGAIKNNVW